MINITSKKCENLECQKLPTYNYEGFETPIYCSIHKKEDMVNVITKRCIYENCNKIPSYNIEGLKTPLYCSEHKKENMIDISHKKCIFPNCTKCPTYNFDGQYQKLYCSEHKKKGMINISSKRCINENCKIHPSFNYKQFKKPIYCVEHKKENMINVISRCTESECTVQPSYNFPNEKKGIYCNEHKKEGMINVKDKRCIFEGCDKIPNYNYSNDKKRLYCKEHKKDGMVDVTHTKCKTYLCDIRINEKYEGYCLFCFIHIFPDKPITKNYKTKERSVVNFILNYFPELSWISDKKVQEGCSLRRPDMFLDLGYQVIIIEIDENQHRSYDCSCENKRLMELSKDINHRPLIFIRFNPDDYKLNNKIITSCWCSDKKGNCNIKKSKVIEWNDRLNVLKNHIQYWLEPINRTDKTIEVIPLFDDV